MKKFEYAWLCWTSSGYLFQTADEWYERIDWNGGLKILNTLGADGWEICAHQKEGFWLMRELCTSGVPAEREHYHKRLPHEAVCSC